MEFKGVCWVLCNSRWQFIFLIISCSSLKLTWIYNNCAQGSFSVVVSFRFDPRHYQYVPGLLRWFLGPSASKVLLNIIKKFTRILHDTVTKQRLIIKISHFSRVSVTTISCVLCEYSSIANCACWPSLNINIAFPMYGDSHVQDGREAVFSLTWGPNTGKTTFFIFGRPPGSCC